MITQVVVENGESSLFSAVTTPDHVTANFTVIYPSLLWYHRRQKDRRKVVRCLLSGNRL
jgi:hypothetical protein